MVNTLWFLRLHNYGKPPFLMGKSTLFVSISQRVAYVAYKLGYPPNHPKSVNLKSILVLKRMVLVIQHWQKYPVAYDWVV
jgi:hypothetical protein